MRSETKSYDPTRFWCCARWRTQLFMLTESMDPLGIDLPIPSDYPPRGCVPLHSEGDGGTRIASPVAIEIYPGSYTKHNAAYWGLAPAHDTRDAPIRVLAPNDDGLHKLCIGDVRVLPVSLRRLFQHLHVQRLVGNHALQANPGPLPEND